MQVRLLWVSVIQSMVESMANAAAVAEAKGREEKGAKPKRAFKPMAETASE
jgi:hypothetical protein